MAVSHLPIPLPQPLSGLVLFTGHESVLPLSQLLCLQYLSRGEPIVLVDGANAFNPYLLSDAARAQGLDHQRVLDAVHLSRVYTCHQLEALLTEHLQPAIAAFRPSAVLCLGLLDPLYDEDVPAAEAARIFRRLASAIREAAPRLPILAACPDPVGPATPEHIMDDVRPTFGDRLCVIARWRFSAQLEAGRVWISREQPDPARWEWALTLRPDRTFRRRA
ncbi:MAG TPA: hypothetical protein VFP86_04090 [bacterium]|nr:hypothetical protein [bacterium]